ncbi:MAG: deoxyuridine 5'-triphosphate nucleotidohydrolase [DPANN group archaeon]|nr:deoxyuridine 5'-triphosphate nucleotidohydrolase [DPANN group archaeon]
MSVLNDEEIKKQIEENKLVDNYINRDKQVTENGFDVTLLSVETFATKGAIDFSNNERVISDTRLLEPKKRKPEDKYGWWGLDPGAYKVKTNEIFNMPKNLIAFGQTRSTLLRNGAFINSGIVDAGFSGRLEFLLQVVNPEGILLKENCRFHQIVFARIKEVEKGYSGKYHKNHEQ